LGAVEDAVERRKTKKNGFAGSDNASQLY